MTMSASNRRRSSDTTGQVRARAARLRSDLATRPMPGWLTVVRRRNACRAFPETRRVAHLDLRLRGRGPQINPTTNTPNTAGHRRHTRGGTSGRRKITQIGLALRGELIQLVITVVQGRHLRRRCRVRDRRNRARLRGSSPRGANLSQTVSNSRARANSRGVAHMRRRHWIKDSRNWTRHSRTGPSGVDLSQAISNMVRVSGRGTPTGSPTSEATSHRRHSLVA